MIIAATAGFFLGLSLIVAIGAQNAFVLRQGLRREHVLPLVLTCAISDAILIGLGVAGFATVLSRIDWLEPLLRYGGAAFLITYAFRSAYSARTTRMSISTLSCCSARSRPGMPDMNWRLRLAR